MLIRIEFVDGSSEEVESDADYGYSYNEQTSMFLVLYKGAFIMYPREFVKSIRVWEE